jgi:pentatricopeptide repeat protein
MGNKQSCFLGSTLVDMYMSCGSLDDACLVFDEITCLDTAVYNTMITGYGQYGLPSNAFHKFHQMQRDGIDTNAITFLGVLSACSHAGLLNEGICLFECLRLYNNKCIISEHYACLVDLLGRAGLLGEAMELIQRLHCQPSATAWASILGACKINENLELATLAISGLLEVDPCNTGALVLLSNPL